MLRLNLGRSVFYKLIRRLPAAPSDLFLKRGRGRDIRVLNRDQEELLQSCIREFF